LKYLAAKQEAFEEANKLKNQFRSLDEDEIDFLDSVMEKTRRDEERVKKETKEGLEAFRRQQQLADKKLSVDAGSEEVQEEWAAGPRKRKRAKEKDGLKGVKLRKSSTNDEPMSPDSKEIGSTSDRRASEPNESSSVPAPTKSSTPSKAEADEVSPAKEPERRAPVKSVSKPNSGGIALVDYGSDDDDD